MTAEKPPSAASSRGLTRKEQRKQKLAKALRANLRRRKAAGRDETSPAEPEGRAPEPKD